VSLRATASAVKASTQGPTCSFVNLFASLDVDDTEWLREQLESDATSTWISSVLRAEGHKVSEFTVRRHRKALCSCES